MNQGRSLSAVLTWAALTAALPVAAVLGSGCSKSATTAPPPSGPATFTVRSSPGGVPIMVDGAVATVYTPSTLSLAAGTHTLKLQYLGYRDTTITVSLAATQTDSATVVLGPKPGTPRTFSAWRSFTESPEDLAVGPDGPLYVSVFAGTRTLIAYSLAGDKLSETSFGSNSASCLTVSASGDAYLSLYSSGYGKILQRYTATGLNTVSLYYGGGAWPGFPCAAMGTGDTLMVLHNAPTFAIIGEVIRYVNDVWVDHWFTGTSDFRMAVDRTARRCYFMSATSDTIYVLSTGGQPLTKWKAGFFNSQPGLITVGSDGTVYATDQWTIHHFTGTGTLIGEWGVGDIGGAVGFGVDSQGRVYVAGFGGKRIVRYVP